VYGTMTGGGRDGEEPLQDGEEPLRDGEAGGAACDRSCANSL
jgi:hypothetical protein